MITQELINYIREQIKQGVSQEQIKILLIKKGWQEKEVDEAFSLINSSSQDSVVSYHQSENQGTGKRKIFAILAVMLGVLLIAGVSFGYFYYFKKSEYPETVFKKMLEVSKDIKSSESEGEGRLALRLSIKEDEKKYSYMDSLEESNINLSFKSKNDVNDWNYPKESFSLDSLFSTVSPGGSKENINFKLDYIYIDNKIYLKVNGEALNSFLSAIGIPPQYAQKVVNQWIETEFIKEDLFITKGEFKISEILNNLSDLLEITALRDQKLGNSKVYHYRLTIKEEELKKAITEVMDQFSKYPFKDQSMVGLEMIQEYYFESLKKIISQVKGEVWIDKENYFLHKVVFELPELSLSLSELLPGLFLEDNEWANRAVFYIEGKLDIDIKNHNKPVKIEAPSSAKTIEEIIDLPSFFYNPNYLEY